MDRRRRNESERIDFLDHAVIALKNQIEISNVGGEGVVAGIRTGVAIEGPILFHSGKKFFEDP